MKRYVVQVPVVILLVGLLLQSGCASAPIAPQAGGGQPARTITVSGSGQVSGQPDVAVVMLGVDTDAEEAGAALAQNNERMQRVIDAVKAAGVAAEDIQTSSIQLRPRYGDTQTSGQSQVVGYTASNTIEVRMRDVSALGPLLDSAVSTGGNTISGISFEISDPSQLLDQARQAAWGDAEHQATQLAELAGATLGDVVSINETNQTPGPIVHAGQMETAFVPIEAGSQTMGVDVQVTWELAPGK